MAKIPNPIDKHVGARVRMRRVLVGLSQEKLGDALGITFQQIQKYEKGTNRIGASRLQEASKILGVPVNFFFEGAQAESDMLSGFAEGEANGYVADFASSATAQRIHEDQRAEAAQENHRSDHGHGGDKQRLSVRSSERNG
jgi:transcriptional regulator with XRE-family HTH domain